MALFAIAVVSGAMLLWPLFSRLLGASAPHVNTIQAVQMMNRRDALVLDVRDAAEFAAGHIAKARHIPAGELADRLKELEKFKERPVLVSCQTGTRGQKACAVLTKAGFQEVFLLNGGIGAWQQAGMPLEK